MTFLEQYQRAKELRQSMFILFVHPDLVEGAAYRRVQAGSVSGPVSSPVPGKWSSPSLGIVSMAAPSEDRAFVFYESRPVLDLVCAWQNVHPMSRLCGERGTASHTHTRPFNLTHKKASMGQGEAVVVCRVQPLVQQSSLTYQGCQFVILPAGGVSTRCTPGGDKNSCPCKNLR